MQPLVFLDQNHLATAYSFLADCADEEPRGFGVDLLPAYAELRYGVHKALLDDEETTDRQASALEDAIIAHLDGEIEADEDDEGELPAIDEDEDEEPLPPPVVVVAAPRGWQESARLALEQPESRRLDLFEVFPEHHGMGRVVKRLPRAARALRGAATLRR